LVRSMAKGSKKVAGGGKAEGDRPKVFPVYFLSLTVDNILCFKDKQVLDLTDENGNPAQWTVILGDNGVGKTTLLRCVAGMEMAPQQGEVKGDEPFYGPLLGDTPEFMYSWMDTVGDCAEQTSEETSELLANFGCGQQLSDLRHQSNSTFVAGYIEIGINFFHTEFSFPEKAEQGLICYGYGAIRNLGNSSLQESHKTANSLSLFSEGALLINAEEWLLQTDYACCTASGRTQERLKHQLSQITEILKRILPDVDDIRITAAEEDDFPRAEFFTPYGWVHINNLGLGYRTAIAWMVDLAVRLFKRYPDSPDPLAEPAIVLIDEIDLHLHPRWQRTIMEFLTERFPNTQFIVTAHSPLVVQSAQDANIVLLRREGDRVVIDNNPEIIKNWRVDQVLTSVFELPSSRPSRIEPLLKRREEILSKAHRTENEEAELKALLEQIGPLPTADTPQDIKAMDIIRRAAKLLENA
jgi:hypothetical protein